MFYQFQKRRIGSISITTTRILPRETSSIMVVWFILFCICKIYILYFYFLYFYFLYFNGKHSLRQSGRCHVGRNVAANFVFYVLCFWIFVFLYFWSLVLSFCWSLLYFKVGSSGGCRVGRNVAANFHLKSKPHTFIVLNCSAPCFALNYKNPKMWWSKNMKKRQK